MRSLAKHVNDIVRDCRRLKNDVIGFTETQMKPSDSLSRIDVQLRHFNINFHDNFKMKIFNIYLMGTKMTLSS